MVKFTTKHRHHSRPHRHRHDYHRHRYSYQRSRYQDESDEDSDTEPPEEEKRIEIDLLDLDGLREKMKIGIRPTSQLDHVATFLRRRYHGDRYENSISKDARIAFYWMEKHLTGPEIPTGLSLLRYRVLSSSQDDESLQITWNSRLDLEPEQLEQIEEDILEGKTVANLRRSIAAHLGVEDPNRVVISACGGLRPGVLQGSHWEAKSIETWLCRHLYIGLESPGNYVILHGLNQEYVYHPPPGSRSSRFLDIQMLKTWLRGEVITNVHQRSSSQIEVDEDDIRLLSKGKWLTKRSRIGLGAMVDFELSHSVEGRFLEEEAWLVPSTETCIVCSEDKRASEMPRRVTEACEHEAQTCKDCVSQWIVSSLDTVTWDRLRCPECPKLLRFEDVRQFASPEVFDRYDILATKAVVTEFRDFRWCLNPRCGSGQIHRDSCPRVKCHACKASSCSYHNVPWHSKETCEAYDRRTKKQRKNDKASEKRVKEITKSCPKCRRDVHKYSGCDHITCICGHEWCYICLAEYYHDHNALLQCKHKRDCKYFDNPPIYEGDRAFRPFLAMNQRFRPPQPAPPPLFHDWLRPAGPPGGGFPPRRPAPAGGPPPPPPYVPPPPANPNADPFRLALNGFFARGEHANFHVHHARRDNDFMGAAAMFTLGQMVQQAGRD